MDKQSVATKQTDLPLHAHDLKGTRSRVGYGWKWQPLVRGLLALTVWLALLHVPWRYGLSRWGLRRDDFSQNIAYLVEATHGAVAAENKRCSDIGVDILKEGGNAVDAAIAATFCTGVVNMFSSGIGGSGIMTVRIPPPSGSRGQSEVYTIDFRETAPALANSTMFVDNPQLARYGGLSVAVPGEVRGLGEAHRRWGKLPWDRLVRPSVKLAKGWHVDRELDKRIKMYSAFILNDPDWRTVFAPKGVLLGLGDFIQRTSLAKTLETIATEGATAFYKGPIADSMVQKVRNDGGILSNSDLENYTVKVDRALEGRYRGRKIFSPSAPSSGPVILHMLNLLEKYNVTKLDALTAHRIVEVMKFGFAARTLICDPKYINDTAQIDQIPTAGYANQIAANITDDRTHPPEYYRPEYSIVEDHGTCHTSVADNDGMAVALTSTVNLGFGSRILDPETGILLNDGMDDFSTPGAPNGFNLWPSPYNYPEPGKRPLSSMTPTIIENEDGSFYVAIGGAGGSRIVPSIVQALLHLERGLDISAAIEFSRLHDQLYPLRLEVEDTYPPDIIESLRERGHNVTVFSINRVTAEVQAVVKDGDKIYAASDSRKNGIAAGY